LKEKTRSTVMDFQFSSNKKRESLFLQHKKYELIFRPRSMQKP
jgi:hypothetical protein